MTTTSEDALNALLAALQTITGPQVDRDLDDPEFIPDAGIICLRDGVTDYDISFSPITYHWKHEAEVEVIFSDPDGPTRRNGLQSLLAAVERAINADNTLGGVIDWGYIIKKEVADVQVPGGVPQRGAILTVLMLYNSNSFAAG